MLILFSRIVLIYWSFLSLSNTSAFPSSQPTLSPTSTQAPTTWDSSCDDRLEYIIIDSTGYPCSYFVDTGVCDTYFCDTCQYSLHYCSQSCGFCMNYTAPPTPSYTPTLLPSISSLPTISLAPTRVPVPSPTTSPTSTMSPTTVPSSTISYYYVSTFDQLKSALEKVHNFMTIEILEDIIINGTLTIASFNEYDDGYQFKNITIFSRARCKLYGDNHPIFYFWGIDGFVLENLILLNGVGDSKNAGAITMHLCSHVLMKDLLIANNQVDMVQVSPLSGGVSIFSSVAVSIENVTFSENKAYFGGGLEVSTNYEYSDAESNVHLIDCVFESNEAVLATDGSGAGGLGGAIFVSSQSSVTLTRTSFNSNYAQFLALDIYIESGDVLGEDLIFSAKVDTSKAHISLADGSTLQCGSSCSKGQYGNCSLSILDLCFANCDSVCADCPAGTANEETQAPNIDSCLACVAGFASDVGASSCELCPTGKYATNGSNIVNGLSLEGASLCESCSAGYYQPVEGGLRCLFCESGSFSSIGAVDCEECGAGRYAQSGSATCTDCPIGTYASSPGSDSCSTCALFESSELGSSSCALAVEGYYFPLIEDADASSSVSACPANSRCVGGYDLPKPHPGYWVERKSSKYAGLLHRCSRDTCKGGGNDEIISGTSCWSALYFNETWLRSVTDKDVCNSDELQCRKGSYGPLCGACMSGYLFSSTHSTCITCETASIGTYIMISFWCFILATCIGIMKYKEQVKTWVGSWWIVGIAKQLDGGLFRVIWGTYQIVESISWNLDIIFPSPFSHLLSVMNVFSFDFFSFECLQRNSSVTASQRYYWKIYMWCFLPILLAVLICFVGVLRVVTMSVTDNASLMKKKIINQHLWMVLFLTYLIVPPVAHKQFQSLDCVNFSSEDISFLRADTIVNCNSNDYKSFRGLLIFFIIFYQLIPIIWLIFLYRQKSQLDRKNPNHDEKLELYIRDNDSSLDHIRFLFNVYKINKWWFEVAEMYRRILFICILPLTSSVSSKRASFGCYLAISSLIYFREETPFRFKFTNFIAYVGQIAILITFFASLALDLGVIMDFGLSSLGMGLFLVFINLSVALLVVFIGVSRFQKQKQQIELMVSKAEQLDWAVGFSNNKFKTTFTSLNKTSVSASDVLLFHYTSFDIARMALRSGLPALDEFEGVPFTLRTPCMITTRKQEIFESDHVLLVLKLPRALLQPLKGYEKEAYLCCLSSSVLNAMRCQKPSHVLDIKAWSDGIVMMPPTCILRRYQLVEEDSSSKKSLKQVARRTNSLIESVVTNESIVVKSNKFTFSQFNSTKEAFDMKDVIYVKRVEHYINDMSVVYEKADKHGLTPLFHYTDPSNLRLILQSGLRMSTQGQGDGGVYFSIRSPLSYGFGTNTRQYEGNLIKDCFGVERVKEYEGKGKLNAVIIYGCELDTLQQAPGGRDNAKMVPKSYFTSLMLPESNGQYFLSPSRILAVYVIDSNEIAPGVVSVKKNKNTKSGSLTYDLDTSSKAIKRDTDRENSIREGFSSRLNTVNEYSRLLSETSAEYLKLDDDENNDGNDEEANVTFSQRTVRNHTHLVGDVEDNVIKLNDVYDDYNDSNGDQGIEEGKRGSFSSGALASTNLEMRRYSDNPLFTSRDKPLLPDAGCDI